METMNNQTREIARFMAIPPANKRMDDLETFLSPLTNVRDFDVVDIRYNEIDQCSTLYVSYHDSVYPIDIAWYLYEYEDGVTILPLADKYIEELKRATFGIMFSMLYTENAQESVHLLMKVICALVPDLIGLTNVGAYMFLAPSWAKLAAAAATPPALECLYQIHTVYQADNYWLHTHGLRSCGFPELELIGKMSEEEHEMFAGIFKQFVDNVISSSTLPVEKEPSHIGWQDNHDPILLTWVHWREGLKAYKKNILGGIRDRDKLHSGDTGIVFAYPSDRDYEKGKYSTITHIPLKRLDNPLLFFTDQETARLRAIAYERISFLIEGMCEKESIAIAKISLSVDEEFRGGDSSDLEHIWFKVKELTPDKITGALAQEPYFIKDLHEGSVATYSTRQITDWRLFVGEYTITPDTVHLLEYQLRTRKQ